MRKRIFDIIQIGNKEDHASRFFDYFIVIVILLNIMAMFLKTFEEASAIWPVLTVIEYVTIGIFCVEYVLRIVTADFLFPEDGAIRSRLKFLVSFDGIIDLLTILPFFILSISGFAAFRILRVIRIFHLFRVNSQYDSFQVILSVLSQKWKQILSAVVIILILMLASSLGIYSLEHDAQPDVFENAFSGIWWSVSCLLTIGYGDIYPITLGGQILAIFISFLGVGVVAIPTGIISAGFVSQYQESQQLDEVYHDVEEIGEIVITEDHDFKEKTIRQVEELHQCRIMMVLRDDMTLVATSELKLKVGDILILQSAHLLKAQQ